MNKTNDPTVGKPIDRVDGRLKVTGQAKYSAEYPLKDLAYGVLIQSTISRGKIKHIDTSAAEKLPGVLMILTHKNAPKIPAKPAADFDDSLHLLQDNVIHHDRQNIGVVVATSFEAATHAATMVKVEYINEPVDVKMSATLHKAKPHGSKKHSPGNRGNFNTALKNAEVKIDATYTTPAVIHSMMEPHATTASWNGDKLEVYDSTQAIFNTRNKLAKAFGIPPSNVRVITQFIGGGFGTKLSAWSGTVLAAMAAKEAKRPVKLVLSRQNIYGNTGNRPKTVQRMILTASKNGKLTGISHDCISESCRFADFAEDGTDISTRMYSCPNVSTTLKTVELDVGKPTWMRAPGENPGAYALESAIDELSYALNIDPLKLRLLNYADKDENENLPWSSKGLKLCYERGAEIFGWSKRSPQPKSMKRGNHTKGNRLIGWGMAGGMHPHYMMKSNIKLYLHQDGTALLKCGTQDIGTGTYTIMTQVSADHLALPIGKVKFELGDTDMPESGLSGGSMTAASVGSAVVAVCQAATKKLSEMAVKDKKSKLYGENIDDIEVINEGIYLKHDPTVGETFASLLKRAGNGALEINASSAPDEKTNKYSKYSWAAHFAEVEVDPEVGTVRVTRFVSAVAAGKIINPKTAASQLKGGVIYGIGMALTEELVRDERTGRTVNADLAEYHIPVHADIPNIETVFIDEVDTIINPLGAKGVGEISVIGVAAAVANAVYHATGKRVRDLPISLDKILT